ncbi:ribosomal-processing cysteine protease Prp ['Cynodon dactylon' phytoplasma]|uniref:ribosomal-processing cysteine protease Prp n=1 Tax='Cynodon dactylon' phytoplasma TaxID=295320 RepID=UPI001265C5C8|nr:ribosomal-processing cysteine protease Prp ['Cynodon dactylon' phytoplasma]KAB8121846.1 ribosomal-processing cysteine protease Prp ['Cynodon dactylon' phytoplasma]
MIQYFFYYKNNIIYKVTIKGHAFYSDRGKDIICASVSTAVLMTLNLIEIFKLQKNIKYSLKKGNLILKVLIQDLIIENLLKNLEYSLRDLNKKYVNNLIEKK